MFCAKHLVEIPEGGKCTGPGGVTNINCGGCDLPTGQFHLNNVDGREIKVPMPCLRKWKHDGECNPFNEYPPVAPMADNPVHIDAVRVKKLF